MKIVISNVEFPFDLGCGILKLKHKECPMDELEDFWEDIVPLTFGDIAKLPNLEQRRIGILHLGLDRLVKEVNPKLVSSKTLTKRTTWVDANGELVEHTFNDTYELYEVKGEYFSKGMGNGRTMEDCHYIRCKDTSTDREYLIWVDLRSVYNTNELGDRWQFDDIKREINAIQCIAWTIQTDIPKGSIEKIIRQGDCVLIKPKGDYNPLSRARHLTEKEYKQLLVAES